MKKIILVFAAALLLCLFLTACGTPKDGSPDGTSDNTEVDNGAETPETNGVENGSLPEGVDPEKYYKFVKFELPSDFRQAAVDYMYKQANVEWTPGKTFSAGGGNAHWHFDLKYEAGKTYHGFAYAGEYLSVGEYSKLLAENGGKYTSESGDAADVFGLQCGSSINHALQQFLPTADKTTRQYMPSFTDEFIGKICGDYKVTPDTMLTQQIILQNDREVILEAYAKLKKGDVIITKDEVRNVSHVRMVAQDPVVETKNGKINPGRSYVVTVEQTDTFDNTRKDGVNTTWWVDHQYTFSQLLDTNYLPITFEVYETGKSLIPYIAYDKAPAESTLAKGVVSGTVSSDYPIRYVHIELYGGDGKLVSRQIVRNRYDGNKVSLQKHSVNLFNGVGAGEYTLVIEAGICRGKAELARIDFTYNG